MPVDPRLPTRLRARLTEDGDCWIWTGALVRGYGQTRWGPGGRRARRRYVHGLVYELLVGPLPSGLEPDHTCRRKACANPAHLESVTHAENCRRAHAHKSHRCGHPKVPGQPRCLTCRSRYQAGWARNRKATNHPTQGDKTSGY